MEKVVYKVGSIWTGRENWGGGLLRGSGIKRERWELQDAFGAEQTNLAESTEGLYGMQRRWE